MKRLLILALLFLLFAPLPSWAVYESLGKAEDSAHTSGDILVPSGTKRTDTAATSAGTDGDYATEIPTMSRDETAFYVPLLSNWDNHPSWLQRGGVQARERANAIWKQMLTEYRQPPLDPAIAGALQAYVARRKSEGGAPMN